MKFLFLDELKYNQSKSKVYGLTAILIDAQNYLSFKELFETSLKNLGWNKKHELKGRSMFSISGDKSISVEKRVGFMSEIVGISKSKTGKTAKISVYVVLNNFSKKYSEYNCYKTNLGKIIKKLSKPSLKKKSLIGVFYDENNCIKVQDFNQFLNRNLLERKLNLFESSFPIKSSLENPGIMFADYVCYFIQTFFQLSVFRKNIMGELIQLLEKDKNKTINEEEKKKLSIHIISYKKEKKTKELIMALKKIIFV